MNWYLEVLKKYAVFSGRARRAEYWYFVLFNVIVSIVLAVIDIILGTGGDTGVGILGALYSLAVMLPGLGVSVRRLHDIGRSGWWLLLGIIPIIGGLILLYWAIQDSESGANQYGPYPK
ncbi:MAG: DUF805 domain-containing protein [Caldilineaceae bacterium]